MRWRRRTRSDVSLRRSGGHFSDSRELAPRYHRTTATMANRPKRHHYLPQFYLDGFTRGGLLWLFDRKKNEFRKQTPINTAVESGFYTIRTMDGSNSDAVEETLAMIEGAVKPAIDRLDAGAPISDEDRGWTATFIATLFLRTPGFRRNHDAAHESMMKRTMQILYSDPRAAAARLERMKAAGE